jgi:hypothetical protein
LAAFSVFMKYARLWNLERLRGDEPADAEEPT